MSSSQSLKLLPALPSASSFRFLYNVFVSNRPVKNRRSGVFCTTQRSDYPLTYEQKQWPEFMGFTKSWNSWNTSNLKDGKADNRYECMIADVFIRRFIHGTWHGMFVSELIIKRRANMIVIGGLLLRNTNPRRVYFLIGYTEEFLSHILKCPVFIELQSVEDKKDVVFRLW